MADYDIVTLDDVKAFLNMPPTADARLDPILSGWITRISGDAERYCERKFALQTINGEIYDGDGNRRLYTRWAPIASFVDSDITQDVLYRLAPESSFIVLEPIAIYIYIKPLQPWYIELYRKAFYKGIQNIMVNLKYGYPTIPEEIQGAVLKSIQSLWRKSKIGEGKLDIASQSTNVLGQTTTISFKDDPEVMAIFRRYRRTLVPTYE